MSQTPEDRRNRRVPFTHQAFLRHETGGMHARVLDISLNGVLVEVGNEHAPGVGDAVAIDLPLEDGGSDIRMTARVVRADGNQRGLRREEIDLDSLSRLRRLLEFNSGEPDEILREVEQLAADQ